MKTWMTALVLLAGMAALPTAATPQTAVPPDGQHDFDWEIGSWRTHVRILAQPLSGSNEWIEMNGTTVVRSVWDGKANLVELNVSNGARRIQGLSLRLYHPESGQWSVHYANSRTGALDKPVIGGFRNGRGEFYSQDTYEGRAVFVRFVIAPLAQDAWRFEQAFSPDGGKTWEVNWIATDTRVPSSPATPKP
jgi:hypothetical protein